MAEVKLVDVLALWAPSLERNLLEKGGENVASQLRRVIVPAQKIAGEPTDFSFMAFPYPRLSAEQLKEAPLVEEVSYLIDHGDARFRVDIDHFGQINWFYIKGVPEIYDLMRIALASTPENSTPFWKY